MPWIFQREERGCYKTLLDELITTDIPGYQNFIRIPPAFFYLIEERIFNRLNKSQTNFTKPVEVGLKLAVTLRRLSTGETYTSLQYHWRLGRTTIYNFSQGVQSHPWRIPRSMFDLSNRFWGVEIGRGEIQKQMECPTCCGCTRWQTHCYEEAQEVRQWILQLQGLFLLGTSSPGWCGVQIPVVECGVKWFFIWCPYIQS